MVRKNLFNRHHYRQHYLPDRFHVKYDAIWLAVAMNAISQRSLFNRDMSLENKVFGAQPLCIHSINVWKRGGLIWIHYIKVPIVNDLTNRGRQIGLTNGFPDDGRGARGVSTSKALNPTMARTIYVIAGELVRLVGVLNSLRPTLESLFHRIVLYSQPQHRVEALKVVKEVCFLVWIVFFN